MKTITLTKSEAMQLINENSGKKDRILSKLNKIYKEVSVDGRGAKQIYTCYFDDSEDDKISYNSLREYLIDECGFGEKFDYSKFLDFLDFHIRNKEAVTLDEIANECGMNRSTISRYRSLTVNKIVKPTKECTKRTFAIETETKLRKDITEIYDSFIIGAYSTQIKDIINMTPVSAKSEVAIFRQSQTKRFIVISVDKNTIDEITESLKKDDYVYVARYPVYFNVARVHPKMNDILKGTIMRLILNENGYDYSFIKYIYTIADEIKRDSEFIDICEQAINYSKSIKNIVEK